MKYSKSCLLACTLVVTGCSDDASTDVDAARLVDAMIITDTAVVPDAATIEPTVRGQYLVDHVAVCIDCHTPRNSDGSFDMTRYLAGLDCFLDIDPRQDGFGCLSTANLTNDVTGLMNRTDAQIKDMFLNGVRPNGEAMNAFMPYYSYHNMSDEDADAIVAFLRTVDGVDHQVAPNEAPWVSPVAPAEPIDVADIPMPDVNDPNYESAMRGRYLATHVGACLECHTPPLDPQDMPVRPVDMTRPFAGGRSFANLSSPPFDTTISFAANLTSDATGLSGWTAEEIADVIKNGMDRDSDAICPPMPAGPMGQYVGLTDEDVQDIANYILSLPAVVNEVVGTCSVLP